MSISAEEIGRRLREAREACGMRQQDVADELGVSRATVTQMELGKRPVSSVELARLAYLFGRSPASFFADPPPDAGASLIALFLQLPEGGDPRALRDSIRRSLALGRELTRIEEELGVLRARLALEEARKPAPPSKWEAIEQGNRLAEEERRRLGLELGPLPDVAELLEEQGVRTALIDLPKGVSGLTLFDEEVGAFVVVNRADPVLRRRFSFAHEYCHVLLDRSHRGLVSQRSNRQEFLEVRANAFAASFLMPEDAIHAFLVARGKGHPRRGQLVAFDDEGLVRTRARATPGSQEIGFLEVVRLANYFGVSRTAACYRLRSLRLVGDDRLEEFLALDRAGLGSRLEKLLGLPAPRERDPSDAFRRRLLELLLEAYRREEISRRRLRSILELAHIDPDEVEDLLRSLHAAAREAVRPRTLSPAPRAARRPPHPVDLLHAGGDTEDARPAGQATEEVPGEATSPAARGVRPRRLGGDREDDRS